MRLFLAVFAMLVSNTIHAVNTPSPDITDPHIAVATDALEPPDTKSNRKKMPRSLRFINTQRGLSLHKPMYVLPLTYSDEYKGSAMDLVFQISAKQRVLGRNFFLAYTQKSFWQAYNDEASRPFRETNYNPEFFYRFTPLDDHGWKRMGFDAGIEHQSNGRPTPLSRSWNRYYIAPYLPFDNTLIYLKFWQRIEEDNRDRPDDTQGDDNPDILEYYGYKEINIQHNFKGEHLLDVMVRENRSKGRGATRIMYSAPGDSSGLFYTFYLFNGYGESLIDYNEHITRVGLGVSLGR